MSDASELHRLASHIASVIHGAMSATGTTLEQICSRTGLSKAKMRPILMGEIGWLGSRESLCRLSDICLCMGCEIDFRLVRVDPPPTPKSQIEAGKDRTNG